MSDQDVRAGIQQAKVGETGLQILAFQALLMSVIVGGSLQSWGAGIGFFIVLVGLSYAVASNEKISAHVALGLGLLWALIGFMVAAAFGTTGITAVVIAIFAGLVGAGANSAAFQHLRDIARANG